MEPWVGWSCPANGGIPWVLLIIQIVIAAIGVVVAANLYARRGGARP